MMRTYKFDLYIQVMVLLSLHTCSCYKSSQQNSNLGTNSQISDSLGKIRMINPGESFRTEYRSSTGQVQGLYSWIDPTGAAHNLAYNTLQDGTMPYLINSFPGILEMSEKSKVGKTNRDKTERVQPKNKIESRPKDSELSEKRQISEEDDAVVLNAPSEGDVHDTADNDIDILVVQAAETTSTVSPLPTSPTNQGGNNLPSGLLDILNQNKGKPIAISQPSAAASGGSNGAAVAEPTSSAMVGPGGIAISFPNAQAFVGPQGVAVSRPVALSQAGFGGVAIAGGSSFASAGLAPDEKNVTSQTASQSTPVTLGAYPIIANYFFGSPYSIPGLFKPVPEVSQQAQAQTQSIPNFLTDQWPQISANYFQLQRQEPPVFNANQQYNIGV